MKQQSLFTGAYVHRKEGRRFAVEQVIISSVLLSQFPIFDNLHECRVRMHYGHPDVFDRVFHITRGGISKASRVINLSEDIFAGICHYYFMLVNS
jgi:hypothetical protein